MFKGIPCLFQYQRPFYHLKTSLSSSPAPFLQSLMSMPPCVCQFLCPISLLLVPIQLPLLDVLSLIQPIFPLRRLFKAYLLRLCFIVFSCSRSLSQTHILCSPLTFCSSDWLPRCHSPFPFPIPLIFSPSFTCSLTPLSSFSPLGPPLVL